jgi:hypothetical protein
MDAHKRLRLITPLISGLFFFVASPAFAKPVDPTPPVLPQYARPPEVTIWGQDPASSVHFIGLDATSTTGGSIAVGDVTGDGKSDIIVGAGPWRMPEVRIFSSDGTFIRSFRAYPEWFKGGVRVAVGDVNGDGKAEIVTAPGPGIIPQVNVFNADGTQNLKGGALAYQKEFTGGVHVAVADVNGDGQPEIITSPGPGGGPHVRIWDGQMKNLGLDFFAYDASMKDGVTLAVIKTSKGPNVVTGVESWSSPLVRRFAFTLVPYLVKEFYAFDPASKNGMSVAAFDVDGDGTDEILASANGGTAPNARLFDLYGTFIKTIPLLDSAYRGAFSVAQMNTSGVWKPSLVSMPAAPVVTGPLNTEKSIEVNLTQQRLYAYEHGRTARTFLVSTGVPRHPTPVMKTVVQKKALYKDYIWNYGPGNPDNYNLPHVKYNLQIKGPINIHYAYWHHNFGHVMSHGCINTAFNDAEWIYYWADVGIPVTVYVESTSTAPVKTASGK